MKRFYVNEAELRKVGLSEPTIQLIRQLGKIDFEPQTSVETATHKLPIDIDGKRFYLLLVEEP